MRRVLVIGCPGAGKSTLTRALAETLGLPAVYLDRLWWKSGWINRTRAEFDARLDAALDYLEAHPEIPVVLTGGTGYGEEISEAACMYDYLTAHGVEPGRLILEDQATNTAENFALSKPLLYEAGVDPAEGRVAVVTNDFHIARAELIAAREGYGDVAGIPAPLPWVHLEINYTLREAFAMVKTFLFD